jgi:phosphate transport system permease protein
MNMGNIFGWVCVWVLTAYFGALHWARAREKKNPKNVFMPAAPKFYALFTSLLVGATLLLGFASLEFLQDFPDAPVMFSMFFAGIGCALSWVLMKLQTPIQRTLEGVGKILFALAAFCAVIITGAIVFLLVKESWAFFQLVPLMDFLTGTHWAPAISLSPAGASQGSYGALPLFGGSLLITLIALFVGGPLGILVAIYTSEYATATTRRWLKPCVEVLAGIPTIVYGFFALAIVSPGLYQLGEFLGIPVSGESALGAGLVMGLMILPIISALSDDALRAVPRALFDNALALGSTRSEIIKKVLVPAALPGIISAFLLAISRAIGETMLALMAVGLQANLTANPLTYVTTLTVQIVTTLTGDQEFESAKTLSAFALALFLFLVTLTLNIVALSVARWHYKRYET